MLFSGDTLLIRGTGRTDFQNGDAGAQYDSIFGKLLSLPDDTRVYPAHDYKGDTVSTIGEERRFNPRLQVDSREAYIKLMQSLDLADPKMMDVAVPSNMQIGLSQDEIALRGWSLSVAKALPLLGRDDILFIDLRDKAERTRHGVIPGAVPAPYPELDDHLSKGGLLQQLAANGERELIFYCAFGERSAMAVEAARKSGIEHCRHLTGGLDAWKQDGAPVDA
jgi:rhodanese-related sulfurtransferase